MVSEMRLSKQPFQDKFNVPANWQSMQTYKLIEAMGLVEFPYSGIPTFLPMGKAITDKIMQNIKDISKKHDFEEIYFPLVQDTRFLESSGRDAKFSEEFMLLKGDMEGYMLSPTNEEFYMALVQRGLSSYRQLPIKLFQIADKFRNIKKPKGILRSKEFLMCDM
ncbi:MAG: hypothetical protein NDI94_04035, partial [Candidatus Woesearchaeota archaeon]|nr:hypothetical protein [Candidatus Woesearchaeota archaeon]